ncbi:MAG: hypothetical protein RLZZ126_1586 [Pseudomonadota bacterium]
MTNIFPDVAARAAFMEGVKDVMIVSPSFIPFALVCGVGSVNAGLSTSAALALPALVYGGSSQAVLLQFLQNSAALWIAVLSGLVVNLRMAIYSAAMAPWVRHLPLHKRMLAASCLVDNAFAFTQRWREDRPGNPNFLWYYAGVSAILWPNWVLFCATGVLFGSVVPASWQLDFCIPLSFISIMVLQVRSRALVAAAITGGAASVMLFDLPLKLGLIAACLCGMVAGLLVQKFGEQ